MTIKKLIYSQKKNACIPPDFLIGSNGIVWNITAWDVSVDLEPRVISKTAMHHIIDLNEREPEGKGPTKTAKSIVEIMSNLNADDIEYIQKHFC